MMSPRDFVRTAALCSHAVWPFSSIARLPYRLAVSAFLRLCQDRAVASVYLRNGLARSDWVPGLSDIDLTVVLDRFDSPDAEFAFLSRFWSRYDTLRAVFPMLGEVDVLPVNDLAVWAGLTMRGREAAAWRLLAGRPTVITSAAGSGRLEIDRLNHALLIYRTFFVSRLDTRGVPPFVERAKFRRIGDKIARYAAPCDAARLPMASAPDEVAAVSSHVLRILDAGASRVLEQAARLPHARSSGDTTGELPRVPQPAWLAAVDPATLSAVSSIVIAEPTAIVLLDPHAAGVAPGRAARRLMAHLSGAYGRVLLLTPTLLQYTVRFVDPFLYTHLTRRARLVYGPNPMAAVPPPDEPSFHAHNFALLQTLIAEPRARTLFAARDEAWFTGRELASAVERGLIARLQADAGWTSSRYEEVLSVCRERYPEEFERLRSIQELAHAGAVDRARRDAFTLLLGLVAWCPPYFLEQRASVA